MNAEDLTKYERARILGARALQVSMNAPLLIKIDPQDLEKINYDALKIAEIELNSNVLPISIHKPLPERKGGELKRAKEKKLSDEEAEKKEVAEEAEIAKGGEIMQLANPEDEQEEEPAKEREAE